MRQLGFETKEEVENFSRHHGFVVENGQVQLDKNRFSDSEAFPVYRSLNLVEGKQKWSLGQVSKERADAQVICCSVHRISIYNMLQTL